MSEPAAYSNADFIAPQALVISDGKPFKSPAVNTVASTFWYYVASTIFMALCVTQDVLKLSQLRKVSTILVVGHVFVFLLAIFRHAEEAPIRVLCRKIKRGRIAVVLKGIEPSAFNSDPQAAHAFERAVEACVSGSEQKKPGAVTVTEAKADENANRCTVTFTITSPGEEEPGGGQGDLARALRDGSFLAELRNSKLPAFTGVPVKKNGAMIDKIDRIDKTEFEKLYAAGGKELLEAAVFEAIDGYFKQEFEAPDDVEDPWERFRSQFCALETFWLEPVSAPHERKSVEIWLALEEIAEIRADLEKQVENAKEGEKKTFYYVLKKLDEAKWDESKDLWYHQPAFARLTHEEALEKLREIAKSYADLRENRRSADGQPTRWNWLRRKAKKRADDLENEIKSGRHFTALCKELGEVLAKPGNPQQPLLQRDAAVTEAALRATEACIENDPDALAKSKKRIDETVLPPLLRAFAFNCFPLLKDELGKIKDKVEGQIELICDEEKSVKATKRMVAKMRKEIAGDVLQAQEDENTRWEPVSASVRDVLRATFVCETPKAMRDVFEALKNAPVLELKKLKNKAIEEKIPFNLHAVYEFRPSPESVSILVEIQIHDAEIRKNSHAQHKFYEITRAGGSNDLLKVAARGDSDSEDLVKQEDMEKIAKRKSYFSRARWQAAMKRVRSGLRGTKRLEARAASAKW